MAILGGLATALFWATSMLCSSRSSRLLAPSSVLAWVMLTGLVAVLPALALVEVPDLGTADAVWLVLSGAGNVVGLLLAFSALRIGKVGIVAPILSTEGAIVAIMSVLAGEPLPGAVAWLLPPIVLGVALAATGPRAADGVVATAAADRRKAVLLACAGAGCFAVSLYATARAFEGLPVPWVLLPARLIGVVVIAGPLVLRRRLQLTRRAAPLVVVAGLCEVLGFTAFAVGSRHGLAVAAVLASQFAAIAAVAAFLLFRERLTRLQASGVSLIAVGVAALAAVRV